MEIFILQGDQQSGPFSEELVKSMLQAGTVRLADLAWHQDLVDWAPLHTILKPPPPKQDQSPGNSILEIPLHRALIRLGSNRRDLPYPILRLCAGVIDSVLIFFAVLTVWVLLGCYAANDSHPHSNDATVGETLAPYLTVFWLIPIVTIWLYFALMESFGTQATIGKLVFGLVVTDLNGQRVSFDRASRHVWAATLSVLTLGVGFLMCTWTSKRQCLHDIVAGCLVVRRK